MVSVNSVASGASVVLVCRRVNVEDPVVVIGLDTVVLIIVDGVGGNGVVKEHSSLPCMTV